jgi:hypothetical protein
VDFRQGLDLVLHGSLTPDHLQDSFELGGGGIVADEGGAALELLRERLGDGSVGRQEERLRHERLPVQECTEPFGALARRREIVDDLPLCNLQEALEPRAQGFRGPSVDVQQGASDARSLVQGDSEPQGAKSEHGRQDAPACQHDFSFTEKLSHVRPLTVYCRAA